MPLKTIHFFGEYKLRYDWEAFENMVEALEAPAFVDFDKIIKKLGPKQMRMIIWAGLLHQVPGLTPADVIPIINEFMQTKGMPELTEIVIKALQEASILGSGGEPVTESGGDNPKARVAKLSKS